MLGTGQPLLIKWTVEGTVKGIACLVLCDVMAYVNSRKYDSISQSVWLTAINQGGTTGY